MHFKSRVVLDRTSPNRNAQAVIAFDDLSVVEINDDFNCNFDNATNTEACNGTILNEAPKQQAGVYSQLTFNKITLQDRTNPGIGKFVAIQYGSSSDNGKLSYTREIPVIELKRAGLHNIKLYFYYNCFDTTTSINNYCTVMNDKINIEVKSADTNSWTTLISNTFNSKSDINGIGWVQIS